jgi:hypothetical protein
VSCLHRSNEGLRRTSRGHHGRRLTAPRATWRLPHLVAFLISVSGAFNAIGCGQPASDRAAVLAVLDTARNALLAGDAGRVCSVLTQHGRERALGFQVDYDHGGTLPRTSPQVPQTCQEIVRRERADAEQRTLPGGAIADAASWLRDARGAHFEIVSVQDDHATATIKRPYPSFAPRFYLVKTGRSWKVDDANIVPTGH